MEIAIFDLGFVTKETICRGNKWDERVPQKAKLSRALCFFCESLESLAKIFGGSESSWLVDRASDA